MISTISLTASDGTFPLYDSFVKFYEESNTALKKGDGNFVNDIIHVIIDINIFFRVAVSQDVLEIHVL